MKAVTDNNCQKEQIVAYLDGELAGGELEVFEQHLSGCETCRADLRSHQLLLCELDAALAQDNKVLPSAEFARPLDWGCRASRYVGSAIAGGSFYREAVGAFRLSSFS